MNTERIRTYCSVYGWSLLTLSSLRKFFFFTTQTYVCNSVLLTDFDFKRTVKKNFSVPLRNIIRNCT